MIVYGDPQGAHTLSDAVESLRRLIRRSEPPMLDHCRAILVRAGQLEQAIEDSTVLGADSKETSRALTATAAELFCGAYFSNTAPDGLGRLEQLLSALLSAKDASTQLNLKVPEGFAFYTLYPEQYCAAAKLWLEDHKDDTARHAIVIGLRSIGTTLSAVLAETLRHAGWQVMRLTVRPSGHPFYRTAELPSQLGPHAARVLIVDEGPGLSGSSFAGVAESLTARGIDAARISFFPSHRGEPGTHGSARVRELWRTHKRYVVSDSPKLWAGKSLIEALREQTEANTHSQVLAMHDVGAGQWRKFAFAQTNEWPAVGGAFERAKFLACTSDGRRYLWKFTGLDMLEVQRRAPSPFSSATVLDAHLGFTLYEWVEGQRRQRQGASLRFAGQLGEHISACARERSFSDRAAALERLKEMARVNTAELLGPAAADAVLDLADEAAPLAGSANIPWYGDGRLAPHEFIESVGRIYKVDEDGAEGDHTVVGWQSIAWDIAGAIVEWQLTGLQREALLETFPPDWRLERALPFYCSAYAAFRAGLSSFAFQSTTTDEPERLRRAITFYRESLRHDLPVACPLAESLGDTML